VENIGRREFIAGALALLLPAIPDRAEAARGRGVRVRLPEFPFQSTVITGKEKGRRILIVGGIHGNEPGAYKAADILRNVEVEKGELIIAPRSNFLSILANVRGYNGDMNRKFAKISPKDPDYPYVKRLKELIKELQPDVVLSLHDGYGFHILNPRFWGQCIVIDEEVYGGYPLGKIAKEVAKAVNRKVSKGRWKIPVFNTRTFSPDTKHPEQRRSLTYYCLSKCNVPAFCLEASKQLPNLETKVKFHFLMMKEFFRIYGVRIKPDFDTLISETEKFLDTKRLYTARIRINGREVEISSGRTFKVSKGSTFEFVSFHGSEGTNVISRDVNMNWRSFTVRRRISFEVKDDFKKVFNVRLIVT